MMDLLVKVSPSFNEQWNKFLVEWQDEKQLPYYLSLGDYARHIKALHENSNHTDVKNIFHAIEDIHLRGLPSVLEAITIGLLETLQNITASTKLAAQEYEEYLLPETRYWLDKVNQFWENGQPIVDDL